MNVKREHILREMGLGPIWKLRAGAVETAVEAALPLVVATEPEADTAKPNVDDGASSTGMSWDELATTVSACRQCRLGERRKQAVLGVGDTGADWLFVGEAPGVEEDQRGEPFVGPAGKLLDNMLAAIGLMRGRDVYIANAVKCRPPENRTPAAEEIAICRSYLERQIELIQPKLIVALGRPAAQALLQAEVKIGSARGKLHAYKGIPLIVSYHPAYLLRTLMDKAKAWEDLCFMRQTMAAMKEKHRSGQPPVASAMDGD